MNRIERITKDYNLPVSMSLCEAIVYIDNLNEIKAIEASGLNTGYLEVLKNSNHYIIKRHLETLQHE
jgi:hypothetical protein